MSFRNHFLRCVNDRIAMGESISAMIVSFHPLYEGHQNITCAGRKPSAEDLAAVQAADAVVLPQGCYPSLYEMARTNCRHVFPNYDVRFRYPDKIGQINLFRDFHIAHPASHLFLNTASFHEAFSKRPSKIHLKYPNLSARTLRKSTYCIYLHLHHKHKTSEIESIS